MNKIRKNVYVILILLTTMSLFILRANADWYNDVYSGVSSLLFPSINSKPQTYEEYEAVRQKEYDDYIKEKLSSPKYYDSSFEMQCPIADGPLIPELNSVKNVPKGKIKLPYITVGKLKVSAKDIAYKPIAEYPYKSNYWAGARATCVANGMRLPTYFELTDIAEPLEKQLKGNAYWSSDEFNNCCAYTVYMVPLKRTVYTEKYICSNNTDDSLTLLDNNRDGNCKKINMPEEVYDPNRQLMLNKAYNNWVNLRCVR